MIYAVQPDDAWSRFCVGSHWQDIRKQDMSVEETEIFEESCLLAAANNWPIDEGLWLGGDKFTITSSKEAEVYSTPTRIILAVKDEIGVCIVAPVDHLIVIGMYDESREQHA